MKKQLSLLLLLTIFTIDIFACTSAIFTGKITADGRPLMWKHRDTGQENNKIEYVTGEKYKFLALYNSPDNLKEAWTGTNEVGFSIMNTASYNLKYDDVPSNQMDREGEVMYKALATCKTLKDFATMSEGIQKGFAMADKSEDIMGKATSVFYGQ